MELKVLPELKNEIPPLTDEEFSLLQKSVEKDGIRDPLVVWQKDGENILVDGHNRYELSITYGYDFNVVYKDFEDLTGAKIWIRNNQMARRNLTDGWKAELALRNKDDLLKRGREKLKVSGSVGGKISKKNKPLPETGKPLKKETLEQDTHNTQEEIAHELGWSKGKVSQAEYVKKNSPENWELAKTGDYSINRAYEETKKKEKEQEPEPEEIEEKIQKKVHVSNNSGNNEWYTPQEYIEVAREVMGNIDLDPASSELANKTVQADSFFTSEDNGLTKEWKGNVWMNPPYAQPLIANFTEKFTKEYQKGNIKQGMVLVNNATETAWFQELAKKAKAIWFIKSRIKYLNTEGKPSNTPLQGQCILYFGNKTEAFKRRSSGFVCEVKAIE